MGYFDDLFGIHWIFISSCPGLQYEKVHEIIIIKIPYYASLLFYLQIEILHNYYYVLKINYRIN